MNTVASARPDAAIAVDAEAVEEARVAIGEDFIFAEQSTISTHIETADVFRAAHFVGYASYSKDFGDDEARKFNQCWATVSVNNGFKKNSSIKTKKNEKDVLMQVFTKTLGNKKLNKTYELEISLLDEYKEQYGEKIEAMLGSFALK